jgi:DNA-binding NarL/FixJ family response regulator
MVKKALNILIVDDNLQFRTHLKHFIENELGFFVIGEASDGTEFLNLSNNTHSDIILMDIVMDKMGGFETTKSILWQNSHLKIIAITMYSDKAFLDLLIEAGFKGCVFKQNIYNQLPIAIEVVKNGKLYFPDNILFDKKVNKAF